MTAIQRSQASDCTVRPTNNISSDPHSKKTTFYSPLTITAAAAPCNTCSSSSSVKSPTTAALELASSEEAAAIQRVEAHEFQSFAAAQQATHVVAATCSPINN
ncbi:hypothetical protein Dimus_007409 [Dionaea muscipula]